MRKFKKVFLFSSISLAAVYLVYVFVCAKMGYRANYHFPLQLPITFEALTVESTATPEPSVTVLTPEPNQINWSQLITEHALALVNDSGLDDVNEKYVKLFSVLGEKEAISSLQSELDNCSIETRRMVTQRLLALNLFSDHLGEKPNLTLEKESASAVLSGR